MMTVVGTLAQQRKPWTTGGTHIMLRQRVGHPAGTQQNSINTLQKHRSQSGHGGCTRSSRTYHRLICAKWRQPTNRHLTASKMVVSTHGLLLRIRIILSGLNHGGTSHTELNATPKPGLDTKQTKNTRTLRVGSGMRQIEMLRTRRGRKHIMLM